MVILYSYTFSVNVQTDLYSPQIGTFVFTIFAGSILNTHPQKASWVGVGFVPWQHAVDAPIKNNDLKILEIDLSISILFQPEKSSRNKIIGLITIYSYQISTTFSS